MIIAYQVLIRKLKQIKQKNESNENEIKRLKTLDLSYFIVKSYFEEDGTQNYENIKLYILSWKSKGLSDKTIKIPVTSDNSLTPLIDYLSNKIRINLPEVA